MPTEQELVALFGDDFNEILLGLQQLPPEVRELLENTMGKMIYDAEVFANRINKTAQTQAAAGIAGTATQGMLATDMLTGGRVFGELRNSIKESLVEGITQTGQAGSFQAYDPDEETIFVWVTVAGHKICADCAPRGGEQRKLREWENEGMPGTGWSVCGGHCYCILDPSGKISPRIKMEERERGLKIQEKGATIRPKAAPVTKIDTPITTRLRKRFDSKNKLGNEQFVQAFKNSREKFISVLEKFPVLKYIQYGRKRGYFTHRTQKGFGIKSAEDVMYLNAHGGINVGSVKVSDITNKIGYNGGISTIRHEYGHFMHHNLHPYINQMDDVYKQYHNEIKKGTIASVDEFADIHNLSKTARDHLKFHDAYFKSRHRIGVGSKWKRGKSAISDEYTDMLSEMEMRIRYDRNTKQIVKKHKDWRKMYGEHYRTKKIHFTDDDVFIKALKNDEYRTHDTIQDLFEAVTNAKMGYGHGPTYYKYKPFLLHETFAELTRLYAHENALYWKWLKKRMPELTTYYEDLIDDILENGYFGRVQEGAPTV